MAQITGFLFPRHIRSDPSPHVLHYRNGRLAKSGRGGACWFTVVLRLSVLLVLAPIVCAQTVQQQVRVGLAHVEAKEWVQAVDVFSGLLDSEMPRALCEMSALQLAEAGHALSDQSSWAQALRAHESGLKMLLRAHGDEDHILVAVYHNDVGSCLEALSRWDEALQCHETALAMRRRLYADRDHRLLAMSLNNVAWCQQALGEAQLALPGLEAALAMRRRLYGEHDHDDVAASLTNVATCLQALGRAGEALPRFEETLAMKRRLHGPGDHREINRGLNNLGGCLVALGRMAEALPNLEAVVAMTQRLHQGRDHVEVATGLNNLGRCLDELGRAAEALPHHEAALAMFRRLDGNADHADVAISLNNIGSCLMTLGRAADALPRYQASLAMRIRLYADGDHPDLVASLNNSADCLVELGRKAEALRQLTQAAAMIERLRATSRTLSAELRRAYFVELKRTGVFDRLQRLLLDAGRPTDALAAAERSRGRDLLDLLAEQRFDPLDEATRAAGQRGDAAAVARIAALRQDLAAAFAEDDRLLHEVTLLRGNAQLDAPARDARIAELDRLAAANGDRRRHLLDQRARLVAEVLPAGSVRGLAEIQAALGQGELLLEFAVGEHDTLLYVVPPAGAELAVHRLAVDEAALQRPLATWLQYVSRAQLRDLRGRSPGEPAEPEQAAAAGRALFKQLIPEGMWPQLTACTRVWMASHRALHRLPFETLLVGERDGRPVHWLDDGPAIAYVPSGSALHWLVTQVRPPTATELDLLAVGDPQAPADPPPPSVPDSAVAEAAGARGGGGELELVRQLPPLRGARQEVQAIAQLFAEPARVRTLLGADASEPAVRETAGRARFLHFACHGIAEEFAGQSLSMLVLSQPQQLVAGSHQDGLLKLEDLLHGWRDRLGGCQLVVLSACRTNVGPTYRDEAPQALPIGFLFAGAGSVISSLWAVDDASTAALMSDFYRRLCAGSGRLQAFTAARAALKQKYPHPFHWAPFLYIGRPD